MSDEFGPLPWERPKIVEIPDGYYYERLDPPSDLRPAWRPEGADATTADQFIIVRLDTPIPKTRLEIVWVDEPW